MRRVFSQFIFWTILCGLVYPFLIYGIGKLSFAKESQGSLILRKGKVVGSELLSQKFESPKFFQARPSAGGYNPETGSASNLGFTSETLRKQVDERKNYWLSRGGEAEVPAELVFASGSGLDPHLSPAAVEYQLPLVAKARGFSDEQIKHLKLLVKDSTEYPQWGIFGEERINVLKLNLSLENNVETSALSTAEPSTYRSY
ncbi:K+-transporting ATPase, C subunit [Leptospira fainei serovar Hurstbridge str. BUT 6]|uniref:Potassium-transporting ATPase KdpC subunit n=1 Tax=Leptospira fainei serovar Hurstbridge str. BUT 6 TaxID=1193011 RepID=S3W3F0_9LEPT|nr:potassium-transporting ATPase subunit KdpC [Leptospira fainei]EPG74822.1 K+-transporting ATPase, C subunit [Leptospira fainei serovar Hurstbridge str. BUT 6]